MSAFHTILSSKKAQLRKSSLLGELAHCRLTILCGGLSEEAAVSQRCAESIKGSLERLSLKADIVDVPCLLQHISAEPPDILINLHYGILGEGGPTAAMLDALQIPYTYSGPTASALAQDKYRTKLILAGSGIKVPPALLVNSYLIESVVEEARNWRKWPVLCKPAALGSSLGIFLIHNVEDIRKYLPGMIEKYGNYLLEEYCPGREFSVGIMTSSGGETRAFPVLEIDTKGRDFADTATKYSHDLELTCPAKLGDSELEAIGQTALAAFNTLGCSSVARVDFREDTNGIPQLLEVNHFPGLTEHSWFPMVANKAGWDYDLVLLTLLNRALSSGLASKQGHAKAYRLSNAVAMRHLGESKQICVLQTRCSEAEENLDFPSLGIFEETPRSGNVTLKGVTAEHHRGVLLVDLIDDHSPHSIAWRGLVDSVGLSRIGPSFLCSAICSDVLFQRHVAQALGFMIPETTELQDAESAIHQWPMCARHRNPAIPITTLLQDMNMLSDYLASRRIDPHTHLLEALLSGIDCYLLVMTRRDTENVIFPNIVLVEPYASSGSMSKPQETFLKELPNAAILSNAAIRIHQTYDSPPFGMVNFRLTEDESVVFIKYITPNLYSPIPALILECSGLRLEDLLPELRAVDYEFGSYRM